jgi:hypothetical protein
MLPVGEAAMAHHTNYAEPPNDVLYANDWIANRTYVFDLRNPRHPLLMRQFASIGAYGYPHSFVYLSNGNTLATFQYSGGFNHAAGKKLLQRMHVNAAYDASTSPDLAASTNPVCKSNHVRLQ